jgi:hypothetical protein
MFEFSNQLSLGRQTKCFYEKQLLFERTSPLARGHLAHTREAAQFENDCNPFLPGLNSSRRCNLAQMNKPPH